MSKINFEFQLAILFKTPSEKWSCGFELKRLSTKNYNTTKYSKDNFIEWFNEIKKELTEYYGEFLFSNRVIFDSSLYISNTQQENNIIHLYLNTDNKFDSIESNIPFMDNLMKTYISFNLK